MSYYRFSTGHFVEANTFQEAKDKYLNQINNETENKEKWSVCTCLGFTHRSNCPEWVLPY